MLIPSTITARRTRRYTSTWYIHPTTHKHDFEPMDGRGRYIFQPPICQAVNPSRWSTLPPPFTKGNGWLKAALVEAAKSAARTKTYLGAQYRRLARRIGANRAAMAVAHSIAVILHQVIKTGQPFSDLGHRYFEERDRAAIARRSVRHLERLGYKITLEVPNLQAA